MSIWQYCHQLTDRSYVDFASSAFECVFCKSSFEYLSSFEPYKAHPTNSEVSERIQKRGKYCPTCGWWSYSVKRKIWDYEYGTEHETTSGAAGILLKLDLTDITQPVEEIRSYLCANFKDRFSLDPSKCEEVVASIFRDVGYHGVMTVGKRGDEGIDILMRNSSGDIIGVQVKRWKNKIGVQQIREFLGALILKKITKGFYVTTGEFTEGTGKLYKRITDSGYFIEMMDGDYFYDLLKTAQKSHSNRNEEPGYYLKRLFRD